MFTSEGHKKKRKEGVCEGKSQHLNLPSCLTKTRFRRGNIQVFCGIIVIITHPYKVLIIYYLRNKGREIVYGNFLFYVLNFDFIYSHRFLIHDVSCCV